MNPLEAVLNWLKNSSSTHSFRKPQLGVDPAMADQAQRLVQQATPTPTSPAQPAPTNHPIATEYNQPAPTMSPYTVGKNITPEEVERKLIAGFKEYSKGRGVPMEQHIPQMVQGAQKYPGLQKNPFLAAATSINETSGGQTWTNLKNPVSWGARVKDKYQPESPQQALEDMMSAVGSDRAGETAYDPETAKKRRETAANYKTFRDTNNLQDFSFKYESPKNNAKYYQDLIKMIQMFERQ